MKTSEISSIDFRTNYENSWNQFWFFNFLVLKILIPYPMDFEIIRIHHECQGGIEKSVPRITKWHHEACRVMINCDHEGQIFLSHTHTNNGFFFLLNTKYLILYWKNTKKASRKSWIRWYATWRHYFNITMMSRIDVRLFVFYLSHGLVWVFEIELSNKGKNGNPRLVCEKTRVDITPTPISVIASALASSVWGKCRFISSPSKSALKGLQQHSLNRNVRWGFTFACKYVFSFVIYLFTWWVIFHAFFVICWLFQINFFKHFFQEY